MEERQILNQHDIEITIERLCQQLIENHNDFTDTVIIGVQPRGTFLSKRIITKLQTLIPSSPIQSGNVDISFYRDDLMRRDEPIVPEVMDMNLSVEGKNVVLIDDVLFTGRSIRSAIDALMAFGRPKSVELLTLIDRRFSRHLPIQPNYVGRTIDAIESERVIVEWKEINGKDRILMVKSEK
ncbi:bifunctional pyr operon transcriptional regulator/uracil phosphoribosyltransferase PyrR [Flavobacteriales bacterium]|nr:bifunctional pyr operon transcriptional regulator/uracil phosphoribosyltransferase PyrR [Flavobacteriales bacterium]MBT4881556.1 bifunctional pyr operon transcriptional regulator/uracil phosphoribosyltransferase PyrR [Flavobacteriales bacterium]MDC3305955.1 bifunctional pyr operon transcriptional regulator/uracil phosphoribosyltransferase PyrR [Flavobacteriales bacterium]MDG1348681.1 bifunctional pyr operon transcriptional regulator/uracil phosphoribosyltransferase PyrR [Flavobacteriales bact